MRPDPMESVNQIPPSDALAIVLVATPDATAGQLLLLLCHCSPPARVAPGAPCGLRGAWRGAPGRSVNVFRTVNHVTAGSPVATYAEPKTHAAGGPIMNDLTENLGGNLGAGDDDECGIVGMESDPFTGACVDLIAED